LKPVKQREASPKCTQQDQDEIVAKVEKSRRDREMQLLRPSMGLGSDHEGKKNQRGANYGGRRAYLRGIVRIGLSQIRPIFGRTELSLTSFKLQLRLKDRLRLKDHNHATIMPDPMSKHAADQEAVSGKKHERFYFTDGNVTFQVWQSPPVGFLCIPLMHMAARSKISSIESIGTSSSAIPRYLQPCSLCLAIPNIHRMVALTISLLCYPGRTRQNLKPFLPLCTPCMFF
jgi:hypothetical protein